MSGLVAVFAGWGLLVTRLFNRGHVATSELVVTPLLGWCATLAILQIWSLISPITAFALSVVAGIGLLSLAIHGRGLGVRAKGRVPQLLLFAVILFVLACWLATHAIKQPWNYDTGLYHLTSIRWANTYPVVPGLSNLHCRLGFNSSFFLYAAMLNVGPFACKCHQLANGTLFLMALFPCLWGWFAVFRRSNSPRLEALYYALFSIPLVVWILNPDNASSLSPDVTCFLLGMVIGGELLYILKNDYIAEAERQEATRNRWPHILLLLIAGVTVKLSFVGFAGAVIIVLYFYYFTRSGRRTECLRLTMCTAAIGLIFLLPWVIRGIILSGYVAYPVSLLGLPVDWKVSTVQVYMEAGWIKSWARMPHVDYQQVLANWDWFKPWCRRMLMEYRFAVILPLCLTGAGLLWLMLCRIFKGVCVPRYYWLFLVVPSIGLFFWFFTAPSPRFAGACFWLPAMATLALILSQIHSHVSRCAGCLLFAVAVFSQISLIEPYRHSPWDSGPVKSVPLSISKTRSGLELYVPIDPENDQCWDGPLPCTPKFNHNLRLRDPADMGKGFTLQPNGGVR